MIRRGNKGDQVRELQALLNSKGFGPISNDGIFGRGTEAAVKKAQRSLGLSADGIVGPATKAALLGEKFSSKKSITMADLVALFPTVSKQTYRLKGGQTPGQPNGVRLSARVVGSDSINCTQFTTWIVSQAFETRWTSDQWARWQNTGVQKKIGKIPDYGSRVVLDWGIATTAPVRGVWLVQYLTKTGGHSMLIVDHDPETDKILTLEANSYYGLDGVGWAEIGNLRAVPNPGPNWKDRVSQTWKSRIDSKFGIHAARLNVDAKSVQDWLQEGEDKP